MFLDKEAQALAGASGELRQLARGGADGLPVARKVDVGTASAQD
jgi:hypothetical protein